MSKKDEIRLSPKHGLNPSMSVCFWCGEDKNEIIIPGMISAYDKEAPRRAVWNKEPCDKCKVWMKQGVILISTRDGEGTKNADNPYRTGGWIVLRDEAVERLKEHGVPASLVDNMLKMRVGFIEDTPWDALGLPRGPTD